jgi:hypothetical protein
MKVGDLVKRKRTGTLHLVLSESIIEMGFPGYIHLSGVPRGQVFSPDEVEVISASR